MYRIYTDETVDRAIAKGLEELKVSEADVKARISSLSGTPAAGMTIKISGE